MEDLLKGLRQADAFHTAKEEEEAGRKFMQTLTFAEKIMDDSRGKWTWQESLSRASQIMANIPYQPEIWLDCELGELREPLYYGEVKLCFGFVVNWERLWGAMYNGRRW